MAIVPKTEVLQVRVDPELLEAFRASCALLDVKPTARMRMLMKADIGIVTNKARSAAAWHARKAIKAAQVPVPPTEPEKLRVEPSVGHAALYSEKRAATKAAKAALKKKREEKWLR